MSLPGAASTAIDAMLHAAPRAADVLGVMDAALYLKVQRPDGEGAAVIAVLTSDAVRLPCALVVGFTRAERSLRTIAPVGRVLVGDGQLQWTSATGTVVVRSVRQWAPEQVVPVPTPDLTELRQAAQRFDIGVATDLITRLIANRDEASVLSLLGRGPGLTPSGDDVLAGFLLGARAFDVDAGAVAAAVRRLAPTRTTVLSAQLLHHAADGRCVPEVARLLAAPHDAAAIAALLRIGHSSGAALAAGLLAASKLAFAPAGGGR